MLQIIIFSFNRAAQLDTLITSLLSNWKSPDFQIDILYNTSSEDFQKGYDMLEEELKDRGNIAFHKERKGDYSYTFKELVNPINAIHLHKYPTIRKPKTDFRPKLIQLMKDSSAREVMFMTDDAMFIRPVNISQEMLDWINSNPYQNQYSLRLGHGMNMEEKDKVKECNGYLEWNTYEVCQTNNWGYHFSVDAHIYSKKVMIELFSTYVFTNPNSQEGYICAQIRRKKWFKHGRSPLEGTLLSFPINMVQTFSDNETLGVSTEKMNDLYLQGYKLQYPTPEIIDIFQQYPDHVVFMKGEETLIMRTK